ncbi:MAG: HEAT repeat domain-containing protein [Blastocatellia bacterium]|nr:HEAT repeat domain-containing protein [Blastocatellia bacterium]
MRTSRIIICLSILLLFLIPSFSYGQQNNENRRAQLLKDIRSEDRRIRRKAAEDLGRLGDEQTIPALVFTLKDPDQFVSAAAALALGEIKDKRAIDPLIEILRSSNIETRGAAAVALGRIGDNRAITSLLPLLNDIEAYPRSSAISALGRIGDSSVINSLTNILVKDADAQVRTAVAEALGRIGDKKAAEPLIKALKDSNNYVRTASAVALGEIAGDTATVALIESLKDPDRLVRSAVAESLGRVQDLRAVRPLIEALGDPDQFVRTNAAYALGRLGDRQAVEPLMDAVHLDDARVKNRAIDSLGTIGDARALPILIDSLQDKDRVARSSSAIALGKIGDKRSVEPLIRALADPDSNTRRASVEALTKIADQRAFESIANLIKNDNDPTVKSSAINSVAKLGGVRAIEPLMEIFQGKSLELRNQAAIALAQIQRPETVNAILSLMPQVDLANINNLRSPLSLFFKEAGNEALDQLNLALKDSNVATRQQALLLSAILADSSSSQNLIAGLKDQSSEIRALAAFLLGRSRDLRSVNALREALSDQEATVRSRAGEALDLMGVQKYEPPKVISDANALAKVDNVTTDKTLVDNSINTQLKQPPQPLPETPKTTLSPTVSANRTNSIPTIVNGIDTSRVPLPPAKTSDNKDLVVTNKPSTVNLPKEEINQTAQTLETPSNTTTATNPNKNNSPVNTQLNNSNNSNNSVAVNNSNNSNNNSIETNKNLTINPSDKNEIKVNKNEIKKVEENNEIARLETTEITKPVLPKPKPNLVAKNETAMISLLEKLLKEQNLYAGRKGNFADLQTLIDEGTLEDEIANGEINGYELTLYISPATKKRAAKFFIIATPSKYGESGERSFFMDETGIVRANQNNIAIQVGQVYGSWNQINN